MVHDYGYICGVEGADGDAVDVFIGPHPESELAVVVDQVGPDGRFDEHKILLGFRSVDEARTGYLAHYPKGWALGKMTALTMGQLKEWLARGKTQQAVAGRVVVLVKADVRAPGSRLGKWYRTRGGKIRYGSLPRGATPFHGVVSRSQELRERPGDSGLFAGRAIKSPADSAAIFREIVDDDRERFWLIHMDGSARPMFAECVSQGSMFQSIANPREVKGFQAGPAIIPSRPIKAI